MPIERAGSLWKEPLPTGSKGDEPFVAPEVELAQLYEDEPGVGIEVLPGVTGGSEVDGSEKLAEEVYQSARTDWWTQTTASGVAVILADRMAWRQVVTLTAIGTAIQCEVGEESNFLRRTTVSAARLPAELPVQPGEQLYLRQTTGVAQDVSGFTEQRGPGR